MIIKLKILILKLLGIKYGPFLIPVRDYYLFIDNYQQIWKIKPSYEHGFPLTIQLYEK